MTGQAEAAFVSQLLSRVLSGIGPGVALVLLLLIIASRKPELVQRWAVIVGRVLRRTGKKMVAWDIEAKVNHFDRTVLCKIPSVEPVSVRVKWTDAKTTSAEFVAAGRLVLRMRSFESQERNFVHATMAVLAKTFLPKAKRYLTATQRASLDLYVGKLLFAKEAPHIEDHFYGDFFAPQVEGRDKVMDLVERFHLIDKVKLFFPVLVQELRYLGDKTFYKGRSFMVARDVSNLVTFLCNYSNRQPSDQTTPLVYEGAYCRCGIMIVARYFKRQMGDARPYVSHLRRLVDRKLESLYLLGPSDPDNWRFMNTIAQTAVCELNLVECGTDRFQAQLKTRSGRMRVTNYFIHLRTRTSTRYYDAEYERTHIRPLLGENPAKHTGQFEMGEDGEVRPLAEPGGVNDPGQTGERETTAIPSSG